MIIIRKKELLENREEGNGKRMEGNREVERNGKGKEEKEKKREYKGRNWDKEEQAKKTGD